MELRYYLIVLYTNILFIDHLISHQIVTVKVHLIISVSDLNIY